MGEEKTVVDNKTVSRQQAIDLLNELYQLDSAAIGVLLVNRIQVNETIARHPTVQCGLQYGGYWTSFLGILNGIFSDPDTGHGSIVSKWGPPDKETGKCEFLGFGLWYGKSLAEEDTE